ncbi:MAG: anhydro-N-acetylmuramic acid kinase [Pseudomonadota bacterium]|nr:anhydro-N-acetylmuramic acid kinase [Pseudomonadota bacterium]
MIERYIGLLSGTSMDGLDAALVRFDDDHLAVEQTLLFPYPRRLRERIHALVESPDGGPLDEACRLHVEMGDLFGDAVLKLLQKAALSPEKIKAIGSHGQTVRHAPYDPTPFTVQLGDPNRIVARTGITTVADFRSMDIAFGGQGAPLAPAFHAAVFSSDHRERTIVNIGGIANATILSSSGAPAVGFDTGPGNCLMDSWIKQQRGEEYDRDGGWAASGKEQPNLLQALLAEPYFGRPAPKSTGRDLFDLDWLATIMEGHPGHPAADVQATLCRLTARTIAKGILREGSKTNEVFVCGGGASNTHLMALLQDEMPNQQVAKTSSLGLDPEWVEAVAFAWLARKRLCNEPGNLPTVTGAKRPVILGAIYQATRF